jgi:putative hydroxymethylpyrimidine transport system substrate-binding protein
VTEGSYEPDMLEKMIDATLALLPEEDFGRQTARDWAAYASWMYDNGLLETEVDGAAAMTNDYLPLSGG